MDTQNPGLFLYLWGPFIVCISVIATFILIRFLIELIVLVVFEIQAIQERRWWKKKYEEEHRKREWKGDPMKVKAIVKFYDRENDLILRNDGDVFEVPEERAEDLIHKGLAVNARVEEPDPVTEVTEITEETEE